MPARRRIRTVCVSQLQVWGNRKVTLSGCTSIRGFTQRSEAPSSVKAFPSSTKPSSFTVGLRPPGMGTSSIT